jgi:uncharacterized YccA/Bax inhibitor family protein
LLTVILAIVRHGQMCHSIAGANPLTLVGFGQLVLALVYGTKRRSEAIFEQVPNSIVPTAPD